MSAPVEGRTRRRTAASHPILVALGPLHDRLLWYVIAAGGLGAALPGVAARLQGAVPLMLAGQVTGVTLTLSAGRLLRVLRRPGVLLGALAVQWAVVAPAGILVGRALGTGTVGSGTVVCAAVPAEITSSLVAVLAAGSGELAVALMAGSLALGAVLTPLFVEAGLGGRAHVDVAALLVELGLCVALPLVAGITLRSTVPALSRQAPRCLDLAALSVVLVVFVAGGSAHELLGTWDLPAAAGAALLLQALGYGAGIGFGAALRLPRASRRAVLFPMGMREFGMAVAVSLTVAPETAAVGGVYGVLVMVTGPALAARLRAIRRGRDRDGAAVR